MKRLLIMLAAVGLVLMAFAPTVTATEQQPHKVYVCKYITEPGENEKLQTGQNPIEVDANAIEGDPEYPDDVVGIEFKDGQERSLVIGWVGTKDVELPVLTIDDCPPPVTPTPTPTPEPTPTPTPTPEPTPTPTPTPEPTPTPDIGEFSVEVCPETGEPVAAGTSQLRFRGALLLIILLNVRIDGELVTLEDTLGDGTVGDILVTPGVHTFSISNQADTEVLAEGEVFCPECNPTVVPEPTPEPGAKPTPPATDTVAATADPAGIPLTLGALAALFLVTATVLTLGMKRRQ